MDTTPLPDRANANSGAAVKISADSNVERAGNAFHDIDAIVSVVIMVVSVP
jgi:hypothetical protein